LQFIHTGYGTFPCKVLNRDKLITETHVDSSTKKQRYYQTYI